MITENKTVKEINASAANIVQPGREMKRNEVLFVIIVII